MKNPVLAAVVIATSFIVILVVSFGVGQYIHEHKINKALSDSYTFVSPINSATVSSPVAFVIPGKKVVKYEDMTQNDIYEFDRNDVTLIVQGNKNYTLSPYRNGQNMTYTLDLAPGDYSAYFEDNPIIDNEKPVRSNTIHFLVTANSSAYTGNNEVPAVTILQAQNNNGGYNVSVVAQGVSKNELETAVVYYYGHSVCQMKPDENGMLSCQFQRHTDSTSGDITVKFFDNYGNVGEASKTFY